MSQPLEQREKILALIRPSATELVMLATAAILIVIAAALSAYLANFSLISDLRTSFNTFSQNIGDLLDTQLVTNMVTIFFWSLVGLSTYSLLWALFVVITDIKNDIVVTEQFLHPRSLHKSDYWFASLSRHIIYFTSYTIMGLYAFLLVTSIPIMYESVQMIFLSDINQLSSSLLSSTVGFTSWLLGWHLIVVVRRFGISLSKEV